MDKEAERALEVYEHHFSKDEKKKGTPAPTAFVKGGKFDPVTVMGG
jgi:hypothetical protein